MNLLALSSLFLATEVNVAAIILGVLLGVVVCLAVVAFFLGGKLKEKNIEKELGTARARSDKFIEDAKRECENIKIEAQKQKLQNQEDLENWSREKKKDLQKQEQRLLQKEDILDKKEEALLKQTGDLDQQKKVISDKELEVKKMQEKVTHQHELMVQELEKVAQLTKDEAKRLLKDEILDETRHDVALQVRNIEAISLSPYRVMSAGYGA